jgi:hypothetical protein
LRIICNISKLLTDLVKVLKMFATQSIARAREVIVLAVTEEDLSA